MKSFVFALMVLPLLTTGGEGQNYLSHLSATADDPVFSTYAAPLQRSEFIVDEGYQFVWYDPARGVDFQTDNAGNLCLAFKMNGEFRYLLSQMYKKPVVTASYSDLVKYAFYPFQNIRVDVFFDVYSSRIAIQDIEITNEGIDDIHLDVYPFLNHTTGTISGTDITPEQDAFIFNHQEAPDSWTTSHDVPYQKDLTDIYLLDSPADAWGSYSESGSMELINASPQLNPSENYCVEWGTVMHENGSVCSHVPPLARQLILHNGSDAEILTEEAPKWGDIDPNIPGNGFQGCELGNFQNPPVAPGDSFRVIFSCLASGEQGGGTGIVPDALPAAGGVNVNIQLKKDALLLPPQNVQAVFSGGSTAYLHWNPVEECTYSVYRRNALLEKGRYTLMARDIIDTLWYDFSIQPDQRYGYIVVARDAAGHYSNHSMEVNNLGSTAFFDDVKNDSLAKVIIPGDLKVAAFQKSYDIPGNQAVRLRILRGVIEQEKDPFELLQQCRNLKSLDLEPTLSQDEQIYSNIPQPGTLDPDIEMMYWNAFNLMRQCMLPPEGECSYNYYVFSREPS
ncbi:MAG: fibronectin type III domain-containing protein, partial [Calditrichia bacterium]